MLFLKTYDDVLKYEKGIRKPNVEIVKRLVEILGVSKEWLLSDDINTLNNMYIKCSDSINEVDYPKIKGRSKEEKNYLKSHLLNMLVNILHKFLWKSNMKLLQLSKKHY